MSRVRLASLLTGLLLFLSVQGANAHELRTGYLELSETGEAVYELLWKPPVQAGIALNVRPGLPGDCRLIEVAAQMNTSGDILEQKSVHCDLSLTGRSVSFDGLASTNGDVLVRFQTSQEDIQTLRATPEAPDVQIVATPQAGVFGVYFEFGIEHILEGIDHLLFLVCLVFLIPEHRRLIAAITCFTLGHALSLLATSSGLVSLSVAPVEATIALSIAFVASEILSARAGRTALTQKNPWLVTFAFGLLHGLGFATALSEVGLPDNAIPLALLAFNVGVETGQVLFVALTVLAVAALRRAKVFEATRLVSTYCMGSFAMAWMIERLI